MEQIPERTIYSIISTYVHTKKRRKFYLEVVDQKIGQKTVNVYINKCLRPNLVPFIKEHYKEDNYIFLPDL